MNTRHIFDHTPTAQEVFDAACAFFATSPGPSAIRSTSTGTGHECVYRGDSGRVCVVGYFLPDEAYVDDMDDPGKFTDGSDVRALVKHYGDRVPAWFATHVELLKRIQSCVHDDESNWSPSMNGWDRTYVAMSLQSVARDFGLKADAIDAILKEPA